MRMRTLSRSKIEALIEKRLDEAAAVIALLDTQDAPFADLESFNEDDGDDEQAQQCAA